MRWGYICCIFIIIFLIIGLMYLLLYPPSVEESPFGRIVKNSHIFVPSLAALLAAVIALSASDPKRKKVDFVIAPLSIEEERTHEREKMTDELKEWYKDFPDPIKSHQIHFMITNNSEFTMTRPTLTFRIPIDKKHPNKHEKEEIWHWRSFNSNLYNSRQELRILEFADTSILSNSNLPYWNKKDNISIWIRMVIDDGKLKPFDVEVSINCENADGITKKVKIYPEELLKSAGGTNHV